MWIEIFGWISALTCVGLYGLASHGKWSPTTVSYQVTSIVACIGMIAVSVAKSNYQSTLLNVFWIAMAVSAIIAARRKKAPFALIEEHELIGAKEVLDRKRRL